MSQREIDLQAETYYDCENGVYDLFTQYYINFKHKKAIIISIDFFSSVTCKNICEYLTICQTILLYKVHNENQF